MRRIKRKQQGIWGKHENSLFADYKGNFTRLFQKRANEQFICNAALERSPYTILKNA